VPLTSPTVAVTGGAGFIGSNIVDALVARGDEVVILDNLSTGRMDNIAAALDCGARLEHVDIRDAAAVQDVFARHRPSTVFHLAAQIDVRHSVTDPAGDAQVNVQGTINVLDAALATGTGRLVYSSTGGALYGEAEAVPSHETTAIQPISPYGQSKFCAEGYVGLYERLHGLSTVTLRYANVYGPRQDPLGEGGVIAIFCGKLAAGEQPVIFGDGGQTRDFVHVSDVVRANLLAADSDVTGAYNIGRGEETSVLDLVELCRDIRPGADFKPTLEPARAGEVRRSALDPTAAFIALGWAAEFDLPAGLRDTLARSPDYAPWAAIIA